MHHPTAHVSSSYPVVSFFLINQISDLDVHSNKQDHVTSHKFYTEVYPPQLVCQYYSLIFYNISLFRLFVSPFFLFFQQYNPRFINCYIKNKISNLDQILKILEKKYDETKNYLFIKNKNDFCCNDTFFELFNIN